MSNSINFKEKPTELIPYNFGDTVVRNNFVYFLILSYALSRGNFIIQKVFFTLMEKRFGFHYEETTENFYNEGGFDAFSKEEQGIFMNAFRNVKKHMEKYTELEIEDEVRDEVNGLYDRPLNEGTIAFNTAIDYFDFDQINSINANLIKSLEPDEIFYIIDAFDIKKIKYYLIVDYKKSVYLDTLFCLSLFSIII